MHAFLETFEIFLGFQILFHVHPIHEAGIIIETLTYDKFVDQYLYFVDELHVKSGHGVPVAQYPIFPKIELEELEIS